MASPFAIVRDSLAENLDRKMPSSWRAALRAQVGQHGEKLTQILFDLASGKAWMAELPDGRCSAPVLPSSDVRLRAAIYLHEALVGKSVAQTEIQKAEQEAQEMEAIRALSDDELEAEAMKIIEARRVNKLGPSSIAEYVVESKDVREDDLLDYIWASPSEEGD